MHLRTRTAAFLFVSLSAALLGACSGGSGLEDDGAARSGANAELGEVIGYLDALDPQSDGSFTLRGWACEVGSPSDIPIHVYFGGPSGAGTFWTEASSHEASEPAVAEACQSTGTAYRFVVGIPASVASENAGKAVYVHGISGHCGSNNLLAHSGTFRFPNGGGVGPVGGPLAGLPSQPGPHIASIEALGDNEWIQLPAPAADPVFGIARGRSWGHRSMVSVPDLRGAYFYGEGLHGYVKPDGYAADDMWFYDLNANRWITVYPGMEVATFNQRVASGDLHLDENLQLADASGQNIPMHVLIHAWGFLGYDSDRREFGFVAGRGMGAYYMPGHDMVKEGLAALETQGAGKQEPPTSPWIYELATGRFSRRSAKNYIPDVGGFGVYQYIPYLRKYFYGGSLGVNFFDPATNTWEVDADVGPRPEMWEFNGAFDAARHRMYIGDNAAVPTLHYYDLDSKTWTVPAASGKAPKDYFTRDAAMFVDPPTGKLLVFESNEQLLYVFDPDALTWTTLPLSTSPHSHYFYDASLNVYLRYEAYDGDDNAKMWAYRFKRP